MNKLRMDAQQNVKFALFLVCAKKQILFVKITKNKVEVLENTSIDENQIA